MNGKTGPAPAGARRTNTGILPKTRDDVKNKEGTKIACRPPRYPEADLVDVWEGWLAALVVQLQSGLRRVDGRTILKLDSVNIPCRMLCQVRPGSLARGGDSNDPSPTARSEMRRGIFHGFNDVVPSECGRKLAHPQRMPDRGNCGNFRNGS